MVRWAIAGLLLASSWLVCHSALPQDRIHFSRVYAEFGKNIGAHVQSRIRGLLSSVAHLEELHYAPRLIGLESHVTHQSCEGGEATLLLSFGKASLSREMISRPFLHSLPSESFHIVGAAAPRFGECAFAIASNGLPLSDHTHRNLSFDPNKVHYGAVLGAYALLEKLGFAFLHPLQTFLPSSISLSLDSENRTTLGDFSFTLTESPHWPERGFHVHTQHPLELTEVLQGHDIPQLGPHGSQCRHFSKRSPLRPAKANVSYCERWEDMVADVDHFFEWSIANRLNKVEWLLLDNYKWGNELSLRQDRLSKLAHLGHQYSLLVGVDVPIGNIQQHGWHMVNVRLPLSEQIQQIHQRVDWVFQAGFDFLTTESGMSEFTHPECGLMVDLMSALAQYVNGTWGREAAIKVHCSTGQTCEEFPDPRTGDPINFNFLPSFAPASLGIFPHTVQVYALDDPTGGSYGNGNFRYVEEYLVHEAKLGQRAVSFYGETAYWVNVDIDVPLFLPLYGQRRQRDLRRLGQRERKEGFRMHGQMNFDSGWEWGYWINDVITARASWNPLLPALETPAEVEAMPNDEEEEEERTSTCTEQSSAESSSSCSSSPASPPPPSTASDSLQDEEQWQIFGHSLQQSVTHVFGPQLSPLVRDLLVTLSRRQAELLIFGRVQGAPSPNLRKLSGIAYLSGADTWVDLPRRFGLPFTQPDKVHLKENSDPLWPSALRLLGEMDSVFGEVVRQAEDVLRQAEALASHSSLCRDATSSSSAACRRQSAIDTHTTASPLAALSLPWLQEIVDCIRLLHLRSRQVYLLYSSRDVHLEGDIAAQHALQQQARHVLHEAQEIVARREQHYRVPWQRVAAWRENPTVYRYGYLWSVRKLYYWWRDQGLAEQITRRSEHSPCFLNRMDSTEVAVGWGKYTLEVLRTWVNRYTPFRSFYPLEIFDCLSPPPKEYDFPRDLLSVWR